MNADEYGDDEAETRADFWKRERSSGDQTRTREPANPIGSSAIVTHWLCRRQGCGAMVGVTQCALDALVMFNAILVRRGEERLDMARIVFCKDCEKALRATEGERIRKQIEDKAELLATLRQSPDPLREGYARGKLEKLIGKVEADDLVFAIVNKRNAEKASGKRVEKGVFR